MSGVRVKQMVLKRVYTLYTYCSLVSHDRSILCNGILPYTSFVFGNDPCFKRCLTAALFCQCTAAWYAWYGESESKECE
jgi:hypothetical protein